MPLCPLHGQVYGEGSQCATCQGIQLKWETHTPYIHPKPFFYHGYRNTPLPPSPLFIYKPFAHPYNKPKNIPKKQQSKPCSIPRYDYTLDGQRRIREYLRISEVPFSMMTDTSENLDEKHYPKHAKLTSHERLKLISLKFFPWENWEDTKFTV